MTNYHMGPHLANFHHIGPHRATLEWSFITTNCYR